MDEKRRPLPDLGLLNLAGYLFWLGLLWATVTARGLGTTRCDEPNECFEYNHNLAQTLVEYASAVYVNDLDSLIAWNCSRCSGLTKEFRLVELIVDTQHCLQAYVGLAEDLNAIVIAFRGTQENSIQNWMEDLYFKQLDLKYPGVTGAMVHRGFYTAYHNTTLRTRIVEAVKSLQQEIDGVSIMVTGHSMGGAMAAFCALDLTVNYGMEDILMVTFGQPRVGNNIFASYYGALVPKTYRMTHAHDMVPHLPPYYSHLPQRTYHHFGREVWIYKIGLESLNYELERVCDSSGEDPTCSRSVAGNSITDHLCYLGVYLQADTWGSCSFLLESNVAEVTNHSIVIKLPLASRRRQPKEEIKSWQSF